MLELTVRGVARRVITPWSHFAQLIAATAGNVFYAVCLVTDLRVLAAFGRPLDLQLYREGAAAMPVSTVLSLLTLRDWLFIAAALLTPLKMQLWDLRRDEIVVPLQRRLVFYSLVLVVMMGAFTYAAPLTNLVPSVLRVPAPLMLRMCSVTRRSRSRPRTAWRTRVSDSPDHPYPQSTTTRIFCRGKPTFWYSFSKAPARAMFSTKA